ncbi:MAG TPA: hypothetical protein VGT60_08140 [Candidatus Limnocylindria bacterium]|nr:hypothetical protein [Candidatus Limnocylindria bacterium]
MSWLSRNAMPIGLAAAGFTLAVGFPTGDPDTYWHLASGQWMLDHREILRTDIFSSTVSGQPYSVGEWLGEVVLTVVFNAGSWAGLAIFRALLVGVGAFFLARLSRRGGAPLVAALLVVVWALVFSKTRWTDRPAIFTFMLFPVVLDLLYSARAGSRRALVFIPPLILLWANLHGGYLIGIALVLAFLVEAVLLRRPDARPLALTLAASIGLSFIDPETFGAAGAAGHAFAPPRFISEEAPPDVLEPSGFIFAAFVLATIGVALLDGGGLLDAILLVPLLWLALSAQRQLAFFVFAATPFLATGAARLHARLRPRATPLRPMPPAAATALALLLLAGALASAIGAPTSPDEHAYPVGAVAALKTGTGTLLNEYDWGGYLIYRVPERKVFVDGRLFPFYPVVLRDYRDAVELRPSWKAVLAKYDVREVLLMPAKPLAVALREDGWTVRAEGPTFVLLAKP